MKISYRDIPYRMMGQKHVTDPTRVSTVISSTRGKGAAWERVMNVVEEAMKTGHIVELRHRIRDLQVGDYSGVTEVIDVDIRPFQE